MLPNQTGWHAVGRSVRRAAAGSRRPPSFSCPNKDPPGVKLSEGDVRIPRVHPWFIIGRID